MSRHANRREFLKSSALAGAGFWVAGTCATARGRSPNEKLNIGIIGVHSRGAANMAAVASEGTVAFRAGKKLQWDAENLKAANCPEADRFLRRPYREGWTL